jgi:hypothetical protein
MFTQNTPTTLHFSMVTASDGETPISAGTITGIVSKDGGAAVKMQNTGTHLLSGMWSLDVTAFEMHATGVGIQITQGGSITRDFNLRTIPSGSGIEANVVSVNGYTEIDTYTPVQVLGIVGAVLGGLISGSENNLPYIRSLDGVLNRISANTTSQGNRSNIVFDLTDLT